MKLNKQVKDSPKGAFYWYDYVNGNGFLMAFQSANIMGTAYSSCTRSGDSVHCISYHH